MLPWVQVKGLASSLLRLTARRLVDDWQTRYAYRPVLVETFVQHVRYAGTAYRAANWACLGQTQGRGRLAPTGRAKQPVRDLWVYALDLRFRAVLTDGRRTERWIPGTGGEPTAFHGNMNGRRHRMGPMRHVRNNSYRELLRTQA